MTASTETLSTACWLLVGMPGSAPGVLELAGGVIAFTGERGRVFESPLAGAAVRFPGYYFGGGCKVTVRGGGGAGGATHRISFVRPNGAQDASEPVGQCPRGHLLPPRYSGRRDVPGRDTSRLCAQSGSPPAGLAVRLLARPGGSRIGRVVALPPSGD